MASTGNVPTPEQTDPNPLALDSPLVDFSTFSTLPTLKQACDLLVKEALQRSGGNQAMAARMLGISRQALNRRIKERGESL
jgi:DNA-binding NtrC family response regulator